jgi:hypothetical protein
MAHSEDRSHDGAMTDRDRLAERGRSLEDDYFRTRDQELIEKMRGAAAADRR